MKNIVPVAEIQNDNKLAIIKAFRIANKRCGECKKVINDENSSTEQREQAMMDYPVWQNRLREAKNKANAADFEIWVNQNGKTGHTYEKDYKVTSDEDNDIEHFNLERSRTRNAVNSVYEPSASETAESITGDEPEDFSFSDGEEEDGDEGEE